MLARAALIALLTATAAAPVRAQPDRTFVSIRDWDQDEDGAWFTVGLDSILLRSGTIRTRSIYTDFVFRFDYRLARPEAGGELLVRAGTSIGSDAVLRAYRIALADGPERGRLSGIGRDVQVDVLDPTAAPAAAAPGPWTSCELRLDGGELRLFLDGAEVSRARQLDPRPGYIAFTARHGDLELRGMRIDVVGPEGSELEPRLPRMGDPGVKGAVITHKVQPRFPPTAMRAGATGVVVVQFVVDADGRPGAMRVMPGAVRVVPAPHPDLALAAMDCVRQWRFTPATLDGAPTAVVATMEVAFSLGPPARTTR